MLGSSSLKKTPWSILFCFLVLYSMGKNGWAVIHLRKIMVHLTGMFMKTTVCKDKYPSKSVLHLHWQKMAAVKSVLQECHQLFSVGRGNACSSMSIQMCPGLLSLDSRGHMAFKEDKVWLCYKRTSHFLERKMQWFFRKTQTHCELQGTVI